MAGVKSKEKDRENYMRSQRVLIRGLKRENLQMKLKVGSLEARNEDLEKMVQDLEEKLRAKVPRKFEYFEEDIKIKTEDVS